MAVLHGVAVLEQFPGRIAGFVHEAEHIVVFFVSDRVSCLFDTGSLFKEVDRAQQGSVVFNLVAVSEEIV